MVMSIVITVFVVLFVPIKEAYAYLDPGTGSFLLQITLASILTLFVGIRSFWSNIKEFFINKFKKENKDE